MQSRSSGRRPSTRVSAFHLTPLAAACLGLVLSSQLQAQQASNASVTVTGIRGALESAVNIKRESDNIVEVISAEDLGKLPDTSVAEGLSRLPGITSQRTGGRAQQISIRGLGPDFATALLNGREQVTTGDSRGVEFDQYPSELLHRVVVYKTPDGGLLGHGLSGTVDLQTVRPLEANRGFAAGYRKAFLGQNTGNPGHGDRMSISYVDSFADRKIGIALGFARLDETGPKTERFDSWGGGSAKLNGAGADLQVPYNGFGYFQDQTTQRREGAMAVLQLRPSDRYETTIDYFKSSFDKISATKGFQAPLNDSWNPASGNYDSAGVLTAATLSGSKVTAGTFNNVRAVIRNDATSTFDDVKSLGWNNRFKLDKDLSLVADFNKSSAERTGGIIETTAGTVQSQLGKAQLDSIKFTDARQFTPGLDYTNRSIVRLTDVQGWGGGVGSPQAGYSKLPSVSDELSAGRLSLKKELSGGMFSAIEGGYNSTDREKVRAFKEGRLVILGDTTGLGSAAMPGGGTTTIAGIPIATFDPSSSVGSIYQVATKVHPDIYNKDWTVKEKVNTAYIKGDIDGKLMSRNVRGNVGLQFVKTEQSSAAFNVDRGNCTGDTPATCPGSSVAQGASYNDVLPSMNLAFDLGQSQLLRVGAAKVMARPTMNDMRASKSVSYDAAKNVLTGDGGNPQLEPFRANALDVSYERYFGRGAIVSLAGFYKDLDTYVLRQNVSYDFRSLLSPSMKLPAGGSTIGLMNMPVNGSGGSIKGLELAAVFPFEMIAKPLSGFGMQASYSNTSSAIDLSTAGFNLDGVDAAKKSTIELPGLSKRVSNLVVYYEKDGFGARVAQRSRSDFVGEVTNFAGDRQLTYIKGESIVDLQLSYNLKLAGRQNLSILFQGINMTNAKFERYREEPSNVIESVKYGKTFLIGLSYKM